MVSDSVVSVVAITLKIKFKRSIETAPFQSVFGCAFPVFFFLAYQFLWHVGQLLLEEGGSPKACNNDQYQVTLALHSTRKSADYFLLLLVITHL